MMKEILRRFGLLLATIFLASSAIFIQLSNAEEPLWGIKENTVFIGALAIFSLSAWGILLHLIKLSKLSQDGIVHINNTVNSFENTQVLRFSFESSFDYLCHRLKSSRDVRVIRNTVVGPAVARKILNYDNFITTKKELVKNGTQWFDLITPGLPARGYNALFFAQEVGGDYHLAIIDWPEEPHDSYLNFTTIEGTDSLGTEYREVIFGWESTPAHPDRNDEIISIVNPNIYNRFERHFENLWQTSAKKILSGTTGPPDVNKDGLTAMLNTYIPMGHLNEEKKCKKCKTGKRLIYSGFEGNFEVCSNYPLTCNWYKT